MTNCTITIKPPTYTLADIYDYLLEHEYSLVRDVEKAKLDPLLAVNAQFNEATHVLQKVYTRQAKKEADEPIYLLYSNLGPVYFSEGDVLEDYVINDIKAYFDFQILDNGEWKPIAQRSRLTFCKSSTVEWKAQFDFEEIFHFFALDGSDDFAPFVCFVSNLI